MQEVNPQNSVPTDYPLAEQPLGDVNLVPPVPKADKLWDGRDRLLKFERAEDFMARKNWVNDIDAKSNRPVKILGGYHFPTERQLPCGLSGCKHMHGHGFLVQLEDGHETHIGRYCGRTHVGAVWEELQREFVATEKTQARMDVISDALGKKNETLKLARTLLELANPAVSDVEVIRFALAKDYALERAFKNVVKLGGQLTYHRLPTERERDLNPGIRTVAMPIGRMDGLSAANNHEIGQLLARVVSHLESLDTSVMLKFKDKELERYTRFIGDMGNTVRRAQSFLSDAARFMRPANWVMFEDFCRKTQVRFEDDGEKAFKIIAEHVDRPAPSWVRPV